MVWFKITKQCHVFVQTKIKDILAKGPRYTGEGTVQTRDSRRKVSVKRKMRETGDTIPSLPGELQETCDES